MIHIDEAQCTALMTHEMAFAAITRALIAAASPGSSIFPVVLGHASDPQNRFTLKSGTDADLAGVKIGSYFPTNDRLGLPRHDSIILLFDQSKGKIGAIVEAGTLNAYRTAAAEKFSWWVVIPPGQGLSSRICSRRACPRKRRPPNKPAPRPT